MNGLHMKYFVLKPKKGDRYGEASIRAIYSYAYQIENTNKELSDELIAWMKEIENETK